MIFFISKFPMQAISITDRAERGKIIIPQIGDNLTPK